MGMMRKAIVGLGGLGTLLVVGVGGIVGYRHATFDKNFSAPEMPYPDITATSTTRQGR